MTRAHSSHMLHLVLFIWFLGVHSMAPGVKSIISSKGLTYMKDVGIEVLRDQLANIDIPIIESDADTTMGKVNYALYNLEITELTIPMSNITLIPNTGAFLSISNASATVEVEWSFNLQEWPHLSDRGSALISVVGTDMYVTLGIDEINGEPNVTALGHNFLMKNFEVHLNGGASWLYNLFIESFKDTLHTAIQDALSTGTADAIVAGANVALASLPYTIGLSDSVVLDYHFTSPPVFRQCNLTFFTKGEFYSATHSKRSSFNTTVAQEFDTEEMLLFVVDQYVANTALFTFYTSGLLVTNIYDSDLPPAIPLRLNTSNFVDMIPNLYSIYPNNGMELVVFCVDTPVVNISNSGALMIAPTNIDVYVLPNATMQTKVKVFTLNVTMKCSGSAKIKGTRIIAQLSLLNMDISLLWTGIGDFEVSDMSSFLNFLLAQGIIPAVNDQLSSGFELPSVSGLSFINPSATWGNNHLFVSTSIHYEPNATITT